MALFTWTFFPVALVLWALLLLPLPGVLRHSVVRCTDSILFFPIFDACGRSVSIFWFVMALSALFFLGAVLDMQQHQHVNNVLAAGEIWASDRHQKKILKAEKHVWITAFALVLIVTIHRYRHVVKHQLIDAQLPENQQSRVGAAASKKSD